jgi:HAD superfamily hydrolase (TIGR01490 family)
MTVHIFDVDYTLIRKSTAYYFLLQGLREGLISFGRFKQLPFEWLRYKLGLANQDFIEQAVTHLAGIEQTTVEHLAQACFDQKLKAALYPEARGLIWELQSRGEPVLLATSSLYSLVKPLEIYLGLSGSLASRLEFADGKTTGRIQGKALFGKNKHEAIQRWLRERDASPADLWFYSDSYTDLPTLELAGHPVAVNPDRFLARAALKQGWEIRRWGKVAILH